MSHHRAAAKAPITVESDFKRHMLALSPDDQRKCFMVIRWFEHRCSSQDRKSRSNRLEGAHRRKLRFISASNHLRVIYSASDEARCWVWAGRLVDMAGMTQKLDEASLNPRTEELDVDTMLEWIGGQVSINRSGAEAANGRLLTTAVPVAPLTGTVIETTATVRIPEDEVKMLVGAVDDISLFVTDARTVAESIMRKAAQVAQLKVQAEEDDRVEVDEDDEEAPKKPEPKVSLADYNEATRRIEILEEKLRNSEKRARSVEFGTYEQIKKMAAQENKTIKAEAERLRSELSATRVALDDLRKNAANVLSEKAKDDIKDKCSKVLDDQVKRLRTIGRPSLDEQARELEEMAIRIRALKL